MSKLNKRRLTCLPDNCDVDDNESSAEAQRMKNRLIHLTGSDTITVNDKDYMEKLRTKIWQEHEGELKRKELEREDNERQRMRRLLARGIIEPEQLREDSVLWREYKNRANLYEKRYRGIRSKHSARKDDGDISARAKSAPQSRQQVKRVSLSLPSTEVSSTRNYGQSSSLSQHQTNNSRPGTSFVCYSDTYMMSADTRQMSFRRPSTTPTRRRSSSSSRSIQSSADPEENRPTRKHPVTDNDNKNNKHKYEPPIIQEMRREETVAGLYRLAEVACKFEP
ncbi:hypothetical protein LSH36_556g00002 [Paralvinella palmiformis]|uniref:Uncharacterized protein n=1 Tax=Paralvinella palmiformis TaxID=53620 RepID=A0AAD9J7B7_9ANNE|nr:hypothetical protein LSH36_556g00002 [Paralvinella palmiformis]